MKSLVKLSFLVIFCIILSDCATIIHGTKQDIAFSSNPTGADVLINGVNKGRTPVTINLKRKEECNVKILLPGYLPYEINIIRKVDGWIAGNIIFGGLIGLIIDAADGAMYKLSPEQVNAELKKGDGTYLQQGDNIYIGVVMKIDPSWEKIGSLQKASNRVFPHQ
jgi:hypothetical protein